MKRNKSFILLSLTILISIFLYGCNSKVKNENTKENVNANLKEAGEVIEEGTQNIGEAITDAGEKGMDLVNKVSDQSMDYGEDQFKVDMENQGYILQKTEPSESLFSVTSSDYTLNGERISIYEYGKNDKDKLEKDLNKVTDDGETINGKKVDWTNAPHIYKKGRIIVIYEGTNEATLTALKEVLGNPLLG